MVPSLSTRTQQHRLDDSSPNSSSSSNNHAPRVLLLKKKKRFALHQADSSSTSTSTSDGHPTSGSGTTGGGVMKKRSHAKSSRIAENDEQSHHSNASSGGGGIWKSLSALTTSHPSSSSHTSSSSEDHHHHNRHHPWALKFKEEGLPHYLHGKSLQGHAVLYIKLHKNRVPDIIKKGCTMEHIEAYFRLMLDYLSRCTSSSSSRKGGDGDDGFVVVVDMKHSKMKHLTGEETCHALKKLEKLCRSPPYPPQMIRRILLIHAPLWLTSSWPGLKVFVPDAIPIHVVNSAKTFKKLQKYISPEELPAEFGGSKEDAHLGQHDSDVELQKLLTKLQGGSSAAMTTTTTVVATTTPAPSIETKPSDLSSRAPTATRGGGVGDESSNKANSSGGGVVASARNLLTVSLRFHNREEEEKQDAGSEEGVETVVKSHKKKMPKRFPFPKLGRGQKFSPNGSNCSKTSSEKSSFSSTLDGGGSGKMRSTSMDESEDSSGVVEQNDEVVETAGLISSDDDNAQDPSIWLPLFKWWSSPDKKCPSHKTTVYYSAALENHAANEPIQVPVPLVGVVPPPPRQRQNKSRPLRRKQGLVPKPSRHGPRPGCPHKSAL